MLRLVARFPLCSVRQPRDLPDVTDAADEQKNKNKLNGKSNKKNPKMTEPKNKSNKKTNFLPDIQEWLQLIKWTMFASVDKS